MSFFGRLSLTAGTAPPLASGTPELPAFLDVDLVVPPRSLLASRGSAAPLAIHFSKSATIVTELGLRRHLQRVGLLDRLDEQTFADCRARRPGRLAALANAIAVSTAVHPSLCFFGVAGVALVTSTGRIFFSRRTSYSRLASLTVGVGSSFFGGTVPSIELAFRSRATTRPHFKDLLELIQ